MRLIGIAMVRNEADVIEVFVRHNLTLLDALVVVDHGSTDDTPRILAALVGEGLPLSVSVERDLRFVQHEALGRAARHALADPAVDAVFLLDADERLRASSRAALEAAVASIGPFGVGALAWQQYLPPPDADDGGHALRRMTRRVVAPDSGIGKLVLTRRLAEPWRLYQGQHAVIRPAPGGAALEAVPATPLAGVAIAHFPIRSAAQLASKVVLGWFANRLLMGPGAKTTAIGWHWRALYERVVAGESPSADALRRYALNAYVLMQPPETPIDAVRVEAVDDPIELPELRHTPPCDASPLRDLAAWVDKLIDGLQPVR